MHAILRLLMSTLNHIIRWCLHGAAQWYTLTALVLFFCVADQALGHAGLLPTSPTLLCLILLSPFCAHLFVQHSVDHRSSGPLECLSRNVSVLGPLGLVALCAIALSALPDTYWAEGGKWVFLIPYGLCIVCAAALAGQRSITDSKLQLAILSSLILMACSLWYDTVHPGTFAPINNRAAGFPGNANFAALVAVMLCAGGLRFGPPADSSHSLHCVGKPSGTPLASQRCRPRIGDLLVNPLLLLLTFSIICMTMSRSGIVSFSVLLATFIFYRLLRSGLSTTQRGMELLLLLVVTLIALMFLFAFTELSSETQGNSRLTRLLNNQRVDDGSAGTRFQAVREGLDLIEASPLLGHGTGFARTMSELPHNIYIQQWVNNGLAGLLLYLGFLLSAYLTFVHRGSRNGVALIIVATVGGIFSHNILDQRPFLILLGLLLGLSQGARRVEGIVWWHPQPRIFSKPFRAPRPAAEDQWNRE
jgi:O-antigen ligase